MELGGSIRKPNESNPRANHSTESSQKALKYWLGILGETYKHRWSPPALLAYRFSLEDLTADQIERGCKRVLQTWTLATMPPPGSIRECVFAAKVSEDREEYLGVPQLTYPAITQEEREAALAEADYQERKQKALNSQIRIVADQKIRQVKPASDGEVLATNERLDELNRQKQEILRRFPGSAA